MRLFTMPYGPKWRTHRSIMHLLLSPKMTLEFVPIQEFEVKKFLYQLLCDNKNQLEFYQHVRRLSFSVVMTLALGRSVENLDLDTADEASALLGRITRPGAFVEDTVPILEILPNFLQPSRRKAEYYATIVHKGKMRAWDGIKEQVKAGNAPKSFGKNLAMSDYKAQGLTDLDCAWIVGGGSNPLNCETATNYRTGLVEAGAEITSVVINNLILYLAASPEAQQAADDELTRVVGEDRCPTFKDITNLPYIRACVKEILRICPVPTWAIKHYTDNEVVYKHYRIPKGTVVLANTTFMHHDPSRYDEPDRFKPERFLQYDRSSAEYATIADANQRDHFTFGAGRRICPAARLAENTLDITLASLLWAFELQPPIVKSADGEDTLDSIDTSDNAFTEGAFRAPKPFKLRFKARSERKKSLLKEQWKLAQTNKNGGNVL